MLGNVPWGAHLCLFYATKQDLLDTLVPYFKAGLEDNEACVWATSELILESEARQALTDAIPNFDRHVAAGRIDILSGRAWYLDGDRFELQRITGGWTKKLERALERGCEGLRISGDAFWPGTDYWTDFASYEEDLDQTLAGQRMIAACTYSLLASRATDLLDVARTHGVTVARRDRRWEFIETVGLAANEQPLTPREIEVLKWVARGKSAWDVSAILGIAKRTVEDHMHNAIGKLGASNRIEAVVIAIRDRIISAVDSE